MAKSKLRTLLARGLTAEKLAGNQLRVSVPADTLPGIYDLRAVTDHGLSSPRAFVVSRNIEVSETSPNDTADTALAVSLNSTINGRIEKASDVDYYRFHAQGGRRDGCLDTYGWVADAVNYNGFDMSRMMCSSNPAQASRGWVDYLNSPVRASSQGPTATRGSDGVCGSFNRPLTTTEVADNFLARGYTTNYAASWHLVRSGPRLTYRQSRLTIANQQLKELAGTLGPLTRNVLDTSSPSRSRIALLFDAQYSSGQVASDVVDSSGQVHVNAGGPVAESFGDGPMQVSGFVSWNLTTGRNPSVIVMPDINAIIQQEQPHRATPFQNSTPTHLQDWRTMGPVHGFAANVLMADGSVRTFHDLNRDGYLNPGFSSIDKGTSWNPAIDGYASDANELPSTQLFSGVFVQRLVAKGNLD